MEPENFSEAIRVTDFWHSLFNSFLITSINLVCSILLHSMIGYAVGRNKAHSKFYNLVYLYIVSGMFVPFAILMMPLVKQTASWESPTPSVSLCAMWYFICR